MRAGVSGSSKSQGTCDGLLPEIEAGGLLLDWPAAGMTKFETAFIIFSTFRILYSQFFRCNYLYVYVVGKDFVVVQEIIPAG